MNGKNSLTITDVKALSILVVLTIACFFPFIDKAFHIDEPLFLWTARQIQHNPLDFYGFSVNWEGLAKQMAWVTQNPPLAAYYLAILAKVFGWNESLLHLGFLIIGFSVVWGTYRLARDMSFSPIPALFASLAVFSTPAFFVSANSVMCDMAMLAAWVWAIIWWRRGLKNNDWRLLTLTGLAITACALTKYFGMALIPLLLVYALAERRRPGFWLVALLLPLVGLGGYQLLTLNLYGHGLLSTAAAYATGLRVGDEVIIKTFTGLTFIGGSMVSILCAIPFVAGKRGVIAGLLFSALIFISLIILKGQGFAAIPPHVSAGYLAQAAVMAVAGIGLFVLVILAAWQDRDSDALLLLCWILGTFVFTCYINWTVSVRNVLPMAPAAGLLLARQLRRANPLTIANRWVIGTILPALVISISVAWADYKHANSARKAAVDINQALSGSPGVLWFQGHWGFQYYMELLGARPLDLKNSLVSKGDIIIMPGNNSYTEPLPHKLVILQKSYYFNTASWLTTMNSAAGAGFYSESWGNLPFVVGPAPKEVYHACLVR